MDNKSLRRLWNPSAIFKYKLSDSLAQKQQQIPTGKIQRDVFVNKKGLQTEWHVINFRVR